jgi:hypothetical protein
MTYYYNEFLSKILKDYCSENYLICMLGDPNQMIYKFKGASYEYMYMRKLVSCKLNISFRITDSMSYFIRNGVGIEIYSNKIGSPIRLIETDNRWYATYKEVCYYLSLGYQYSDIYIISPSTKCKSYNSKIKLLQQLLTYHNIFIEIPDESFEKSLNLYTNKLLINTIHGMKGLENKIVIFTMFDKTYNNFTKLNENNMACPNEIYVALTRATQHLSLISNGNYFDFFNKSILNSEYVQIVYYSFYSSKSLAKIYPVTYTDNIIKCVHGGILDTHTLDEFSESKIYRICYKCITKKIISCINCYNWNNYPNKNFTQYIYKKNNYSVLELLSFVTIDDIIYIDQLNIYQLKKTIYSNKIDNVKKNIKQKFRDVEIYESVYSLIGRIVVYYIEYCLTNNLQIINNDTVRKNVSLKYFNKICDKDKILNELKQNIKKNKCCELLTIIAIYDEMIHIYFTHRAELQIKNYNIINIKLLEKIYKRFIKLSGLSNQNVNTIFEVSVQKIINNKKIQGAIDMIYNDTIIEFKCKTFTTKEDIYQLLIYAYLLDKKFNKYKLVNLYTSEYIDIIINDHDKIIDIINYFINKKK